MITPHKEKHNIPLSVLDTVLTSKDLLSGKVPTAPYFSMFMNDNSMSPRIVEGDILILTKQRSYENDKIFLVCLNNEVVLVRRVQVHPNGIILKALNPDFDPIFVSSDQLQNDSIRFFGRVIEVRSYFINGMAW